MMKMFELDLFRMKRKGVFTRHLNILLVRTRDKSDNALGHCISFEHICRYNVLSIVQFTFL